MTTTKTILSIIVWFIISLAPISRAEETAEIKLDAFGGVMSWQGKATGRFHLETINGRHCLVTPAGHGFLSLGVTHIGGLARQSENEFDLFGERFDRDWAKASMSAYGNLKAWGYNTVGYDSPRPIRRMMPYMADCYPAQTSSWRALGDFDFADVFDPNRKQYAKRKIQNMVLAERGNPNLIGYYWTDIPQWDLERARKTRGLHWVDFIRKLPREAPGKRRYLQFVEENGDKADDEGFLRLIAREFYRCVGEETRRLDPDGLVFGERYLFSDVPDIVIREALPYIDAIALQPGGANFDAALLDRLHQLSGKPILLCDHQCSFPTSEFAKTMWQQLPSADAVGKAHAEYLEQAFAKPYILGYHRCQYIDRFKVRQGVLKQGLLRADGSPYQTLTRAVTENNHAALQRFAQESRRSN